jgi:hypothetical protein
MHTWLNANLKSSDFEIYLIVVYMIVMYVLIAASLWEDSELDASDIYDMRVGDIYWII